MTGRPIAYMVLSTSIGLMIALTVGAVRANRSVLVFVMATTGFLAPLRAVSVNIAERVGKEDRSKRSTAD
jgi:hypothetical protein